MRRQPPPSDLVIYPSVLREVKGVSELSAIVSTGRYIAERKYDGYRAVMIKSGQNVWFVSKNGYVLHGFDALGAELCKYFADYRVLVLDGEIASFDEDDNCNFANVHLRRGPYTYVAFDFIRVNTLDARTLPLSERKKYLRRIVSRRLPFLRHAAALRGQPPALMKWAINHGHEGIVLKEIDFAYVEGPETGSWIKIKRPFSQDELRLRNRLFAR